jgi:ParB family chromosome partitioning protein
MQSVSVDRRVSFGGEIVEIPLNLIDPGRINIRSSLGDLDDLKDSVAQYGLLSPILVRNVASSRYEVVAGNRRLKVFEDLGFRRIPASIIQAGDKECYEVYLTENVQRQTLDPFEEARAFYNYVCSKGKRGLGYGSVTELAMRIGKSQEYVSNRIGLLRLRKSTLRQMLGERKLTISHVEGLVSISDNPVAVKELSALIATHRISVRVLEKTVQLIKSGVGTARALELARIESGMGLESTSLGCSSDRLNELLRRTKRILEYTLSYIDTTLPELEKEPATYRCLVENVRLPIHKAIDGAIACQKRHRRINIEGENSQEAIGKHERRPRMVNS